MGATLGVAGCLGDPPPGPEATIQAEQKAKEAVRDYYRMVNRSGYRQAYAFLSGPAQGALPFADFRDYERSTYYGMRRLNVLESSPERVKLRAQLVVTYIGAACDFTSVHQRQMHDWTMVKTGNRWRGDWRGRILGGDKLPVSYDECPPIATAPTELADDEEYAYPDDSDYDPYYDDLAGYDDPSYDNPNDLDCDSPGVGSSFPVYDDDPNGFDRDGDGVGCEG